MFELVSSKTKIVTPQLAEYYLGLNNYVGQRPLRNTKVNMLAKKITTKKFHFGHIATARALWNGQEEVVVNGQHQLTAVACTGVPIRAQVEEYKCKTPEELAELYRQFDAHGIRTLSERAIPEIAALGLNWKKKFISVMLAAIAYHEETDARTDGDERVESIKKYIKEGNEINNIICCVPTHESKHLMRSPVVAAMIVTYRKSNADFEEFWEQVRDGENLKSNSPALKLRNYLMTTSVSFGRGKNADSLNTAATYKEMYSKCISAWNAFRTKGKTALKYFADKPAPNAL